jgi:hypothetical protein
LRLSWRTPDGWILPPILCLPPFLKRSRLASTSGVRRKITRKGSLGTDAYDLADQRPKIFAHKICADWISIHNRPEDLEWAEGKVHWLFEQAGIPCPDIVIE